MPKLLQINVTSNTGSTGRIAENIGKIVQEEGWLSYIAYGREAAESSSELIKIGSNKDINLHGLQTRIFDRHGLGSVSSTKSFIEDIKKIDPDIIHLHNIHGYYLNYKILFEYLKKWGGPIVWTLHDCWSFTGHCAHYDFIGCDKWKTTCFNCPQKSRYPKSLFLDRSAKNHVDKKNTFLGCENLTIVAVSDWLDKQIEQSFLKDYKRKVIKNGIDLGLFRPLNREKPIRDKFIILGVAGTWDERKGLDDFIKLRKYLPQKYEFVLIGLNKKQIRNLPEGIIGIERTENIEELVDWYNCADVYLNLSVEETLGLTSVEALACGTPAIVYRATASPETIDYNTGIVVPRGDLFEITAAIRHVCESAPFKICDCRGRAELFFDKNKNFQKYLELYKGILDNCN